MVLASDPTQPHADLDEVKSRINVNTTVTLLDTKLKFHMNFADNYTNTQIGLHALIPLDDPDPDLVSLSSTMAAAEYDFWTNPEKTGGLIEARTTARQDIIDYIMAKYGRKNPNGLGGGNLFITTKKITGKSS